MIGLPKPQWEKRELFLDARNRLISDQNDPDETPETDMPLKRQCRAMMRSSG